MTNTHEQYFTPPELTRALLERMNLNPATIAEPCVGDRWIARELERDGHTVISGDVDPQYDPTGESCDIFSKRAAKRYKGVDAIISNPPWSIGPQCVRRALEFTPNVAMLLRLTFLEPCDSNPESRRVGLLQRLNALAVMPRTSFIKGKAGVDSAPPVWLIWGFEWLGLKPFDIATRAELIRHAGQLDMFPQSE